MKQYFNHFFPGLTESHDAGQRFWCSLAGTSIELDQADVERNTRPFHQAGTLELLTCTVDANTLSGNLTWRTVIGATGTTDGNCSVVFATTETGTLEDDSNTEDVADTDLYCFECEAASGTGSADLERCSMVWEPDTGSITLLGSKSASSLGVAANGTTYVTASGFRNANTTEARTQNIISAAGTWQYLGIGVSTITVTTIDIVTTSRIDGVDGNQTVALDETTTLGYFEDDTNSDTVALGDLLDWEVVTTNSTNDGGTNIEWFASQIDSTGDADYTMLLTGGPREQISTSDTEWFTIGGQTNGVTTEAAVQHAITIAATASHLAANTSQNSGTLVGTFRINGADGNQSVSVVSSPSTDIDESNTDDLADGDLLAFEGFASGGQIQVQGISLKLTEASSVTTVTVPNANTLLFQAQTPSVAGGATITPNATAILVQPQAPSVGGGASITADAASLLLSPITPADIAAGAAIYPPVAAEITIFPQAPEVDTHASVNSPSAQILVEILIPTLSAQLPPIEPAVVQTFIEVLAPIVKGGASVDIGAPVSIVLATPTPGIVAGGADVNINAETGIIQISVFEGALVGPITGALSGIFGVSVGRGLTYAKGVSDRRKGVGKPNASEEF